MESASCLKSASSNLMIVFLISSSSQSRLLSFTCSLCTSFKAFVSLILFRALRNHIIQLFNDENNSWKELEEEVCLFFVSRDRKSFNNSGEPGKVLYLWWHSIFVVDWVKFDRVMID